MAHFTPQAPARILVVDDHPIVRLGIRQLISQDPGLMVCGEADSMEASLQAVGGGNIDLALVDLSLEHGAGLELVRALHEVAPTVPVLVLSMHDEALFAERALKAGARGYIMKDAAVEGLVGAIRRVLSGRVHLSERMAERALEGVGRGLTRRESPVANLTDRELEVFEMIGRGLSTAAIADDLGVSVKTIETYRSNIKSKLNLEDAADLIRYAAIWTSRL